MLREGEAHHHIDFWETGDVDQKGGYAISVWGGERDARVVDCCCVEVWGFAAIVLEGGKVCLMQESNERQALG